MLLVIVQLGVEQQGQGGFEGREGEGSQEVDADEESDLAEEENDTFVKADIHLRETLRVLRDRRYFALYVSDSYKKGKGFVPLGARLSSMCEALGCKAVDQVAVVRGNRKLEKPNFHKAAEEGNFFLRGFNHLLIFKKEQVVKRDMQAAPPKQRRS